MIHTDTSTNDLRSRVRKALKDNAWTEADFARKCGVPQSTVKRFLDGSDPLYSTACKIKQAITPRTNNEDGD